MGLIPEDVDIPKDREVSMLERVSMKDQTVYEESRSVSLGDSTFKCGKCHEYFKFIDTDSLAPILIRGKQKEELEKKFKPLIIVKKNAVMNSVASLVSLIEQYGCSYDENDESLVIIDKNGKEYRLAIANELFNTFYMDNPMFSVKKHEKWAFESEDINRQK